MVERASDDHVHPQRLLSADGIGRPQAEQRHVDEDVRPIAQLRQPPHPLHRELDLPDALCQRNVDGLERVSADHSVRLEAMPRLKTPDGVHDRARVGGIGDRGAARQVTEDAQARRQLWKAGPCLAGLDFGLTLEKVGNRGGFTRTRQRPVRRKRALGAAVVRHSRFKGIERGAQSLRVARVAEHGGKVERLLRDVIAPVHRRRVDAADVHATQHTRRCD